MRLKTHWFRPEQPKSAAQSASALAFIVWRVARNTIERLRKAGFDVDAGPPYFGCLRELLIFLVQVADRIAHATQPAPARAAFTTELVLRVAALLEENETDLLGARPDGEPGWADLFVTQCNVVAGHYAEFGWEDDGPDFGFRRYLGSRLEPFVPAQDRHWVVAQVMDVEVPEAVALVRRGMQGVFSGERAPRRAGAASGD